MTTSRFGVEIYDRSGQALPAQGDLALAPITWTGAAVGGPKSAEIAATGNRAALKNALLNWLRYGVVITTPSSGACWWGYVHEIALTLDGVEIVSSLDNLRNRVAVTHTHLEGVGETALTTAWADDLASQGQYGIREHYQSLGQASAAMATAHRDRLLAQYAYPRLRRSLLNGGQTAAVLRCRGWLATNGWRYYQRTDGRLEHMPADTLAQPIGWGIAASNQVGFGDGAIHDAWGRLADLAAGMKIAVTGSASNNKTFTVLDGTSEEVESYSNNTIYFQPSDDIFDAAAGMGMVGSEHWLLVTGSAGNSRWHRVGAGGADHVRTSASVSGAIVAEGTGPTIGLYQAQRMSTLETAVYEAPGSANVTIVHHGQHVAQRVTLGTAMKIDGVMVEVGKVGAPASAFQVRIFADSAGSINTGAQLTSGSIAAAALSEDLAAVWVPVTEISLAAGSYWIVVRPASGSDGQNYYRVGMTATAYESCQMWTGSAWVGHAPGWYLKFRLWAVEDTGLMLETMLAEKMQFVALSGGFLSGVNGYPAMDSLAVVADEFDRLLAVGTAAGERVLADVSPDRVLHLYAQPSAAVSQSLMVSLATADGKLRLYDAAGSPWPAGILPAGMWALLADIDSDLAAVGGLSPAFIEEATYTPETDSWEIAFEGERDLAALLRVQEG